MKSSKKTSREESVTHYQSSTRQLKKSGGIDLYKQQTRSNTTDQTLSYGTGIEQCALQCVLLDFNTVSRQRNKADKYMPSISELQQMYPGFKYQVAPIILGALGTVPNRLKEELLKLSILEDQVLQKNSTAIIGSIKIMKTFIKL